MTLKQTILRMLFGLELIVIAGFYVFGAHGLRYVWQLQREQTQIEQEVAALASEVDALEHEVHDWHTHTFNKEKIAREQLQMAKPGETIYYLS